MVLVIVLKMARMGHVAKAKIQTVCIVTATVSDISGIGAGEWARRRVLWMHLHASHRTLAMCFGSFAFLIHLNFQFHFTIRSRATRLLGTFFELKCIKMSDEISQTRKRFSFGSCVHQQLASSAVRHGKCTAKNESQISSQFISASTQIHY